MSLERKAELVRELCRVLRDRPDGMRGTDVLAEVARRLPPTEPEAEVYERSNARRYEKVIRFSSINVVKAGWVVKAQGTWFLTEDGARALDAYPEAGDFYAEARRRYREWARSRGAEEPVDAGEDDDTVSRATAAVEEAEEAAWAEIERYVTTMPPYDFQDLVGALLRAMDFHVDWIAPRGRDQGIDLIAYSDPLGVTGPRIVVQVKRRASPVDPGELRSFLAVLGDRDVGIFVSVGGFTSEAEREARTQERRRLTLIDLRRFVRLWIEHAAQMDEVDRQRLPLRAVHFLAPPE